MKVFTIASVALRRLARERTTLFITFILPLLLILLLGMLYGEPEYRMGLVVEDDGPLATELATALRSSDGLKVTDYDSPAELVDVVAHNDRDAGIIIGAGYDAAIRAGDTAVLEYMVTGDIAEFGVSSVVEEVVTAQASRVVAARLADQVAGVGFDSGLAIADEVAADTEGISVQLVGAGDGELAVLGTFDGFATRMMLLMVFLVAAAGAGDLIRSRDLGMSRRMLGTPTSAATIIGGETAGRFLIAFVQTMVIVVVAAVAFGVNWGYWPATLAILIAYALAAAGAGMLLGSLLRSATLAEGLGTAIALGLGMLGGLMFGGSLPVPQGLANEAIAAIQEQGAGLMDVTTELGGLLAFAAAFMLIAAPALRRSITKG